MCNQKWAQIAGFALLETLIAFVVLAVGLLALLSFHNESQQNTAEAKARSEAVAIGEQKLQELQSFLSAGDPRLADGSAGTDVYTGVNAVFTRNWNVSTTTSADVNLAQISVQWGNVGTGVELKSEIYRHEPSSSTENFLEVVKNYSGNAGGPGGDWFGTGTDTGTGGDGPGDDEDAGDNGNGDDGSNNDEEVGVDYYLTLSGDVDALGGNDGSLDGVTVENNPDSFAATWDCNYSNSGYSCTSSGIPENLSWSGAIIFSTSKWFCLSGDNSRGTLRQAYTNIDTNQVYDVKIRKNDNFCG